MRHDVAMINNASTFVSQVRSDDEGKNNSKDHKIGAILMGLANFCGVWETWE